MTPTLAELLDAATVVKLPLRASFRGITERELVLFEGPAGWAEFAPFRDHPAEHAAAWLRAGIEQAFGSWPLALRERIPVNAIVPDVPAADIAPWVAPARAAGITSFKLKVASGSLTADVARLAALRSAVGDAQIRVDANAKWTAEQAIVGINTLQAAVGELEYVEQPCVTLAECAEVRRATGCKVAVDEGIRLAADPIGAKAELHAAADVVVLKAIPNGGVQHSLEIATALELPVVVSGSLDSAIGLAAGLQLAGCVPQLSFACGLATGALFAEDLIAQPQPVVDGALRIGRVSPDPDLLAKAAARVSAEAQHYWRERLTRCYELLVAA